MPTEVSTGAGGDTRFEKIPREECLALLAAAGIGRVAVADPGSAPLVVPVNYVLDGENVVFRTDYGAKLHLAVTGAQPVSFEIDGLDAGRRSGWSVLVRGAAAALEAPDVERLSLAPWAPGGKTHWVTITPVSITGRRIRLAGGGTDARGYL